MAAQSINIKQDFPVPAKKVFDFFLDHNRWSELMPLKVKRIKEGETELNGKGSVRHLAIPLAPLEETITKVIDGKQIEYTITKGAIAKSHYGTIKFIDKPNNTSSVDYTIEMESVIPFTTGLILTGLKFGLKDFTKKLAKEFKKNPNF